MVSRPRIFALLDRWLSYRVTLIRATAGYGKTSLAAGWLAEQPVADNALPYAAWLSLDPDDADPVRFIHYLAAALDRAQPGLFDAVQPILDDTWPDPAHAMSALLLAMQRAERPNQVNGAGSLPLLLILDDYHRAESPAINTLLDQLLERAPAYLRVLILSRTLPTLSLPRLVLNGSLLELTANDLRFSRDELIDFMTAQGSPPLEPDQLDTLLRRTEGWIAGIKLAAISMGRQRGSTDSPVATGENGDAPHGIAHATDEWQAEYLTGEVLNRRSPALRQFLLQTSILDRFNADLCAAVTDRDDADVLLDDAFNGGLFLVPLDREHYTYRYHHLFQEVLQARLLKDAKPDDIRQLHRRAADWHAAAWQQRHQDGEDSYDLGDAALGHYLAAGDVDAAAALLDPLVRQALDSHDYHRAELLLGRLPERDLDQRADLLLLLLELNFRRRERTIIANVNRVEQALQNLPTDAPSRPALEARLSAFWTFAALHLRKLDLMQAHAARAEEREHLLSHFERGLLRLMQSEAAIDQLSWDRVEDGALKASAAFIQAGYAPGIILARQQFTCRLYYVGRLLDVARALEEIVDDYPLPQPNHVLRHLQYTIMAAGEMYYWMNDLDRMRGCIVRGARMATDLSDEFMLSLAAQFLDLHNLANPDSPETGYLRPRLVDVNEAGIFPFNVEFEIAYQVGIGNTRAALILSRYGHDTPPNPDETSLQRLFAYLLAQVAAGHALPALEGIVAWGLERFSRYGILHYLGRLQAIEAWRQLQMGNKNRAITLLEEAAVISEQTGMLRHILNIPALWPLLLLSTHPAARKLSQLLRNEPDSVAQRIAQLSALEQDILIQLTKDYRYADIATYYGYSLDRIRYFIKRIYRVLGVNSRVGAIEAARRAGLA